MSKGFLAKPGKAALELLSVSTMKMTNQKKTITVSRPYLSLRSSQAQKQTQLGVSSLKYQLFYSSWNQMPLLICSRNTPDGIT